MTEPQATEGIALEAAALREAAKALQEWEENGRVASGSDAGMDPVDWLAGAEEVVNAFLASLIVQKKKRPEALREWARRQVADGMSIRATARYCGVAASTVQEWVGRRPRTHRAPNDATPAETGAPQSRSTELGP